MDSHICVVILFLCVYTNAMSIGGQTYESIQEDKFVQRIVYDQQRQEIQKLEEILLQCVKEKKDVSTSNQNENYFNIKHYDYLLEALSKEKDARQNLENVVNTLHMKIEQLTSSKTLQDDIVSKDFEKTQALIQHEQNKIFDLESLVNRLQAENNKTERNVTFISDKLSELRKTNDVLSLNLENFEKIHDQEHRNISYDLESFLGQIENHDNDILALKQGVKGLHIQHSKFIIKTTTIDQKYTSLWQELSEAKTESEAIRNDVNVLKKLDDINALKRTDAEIKELKKEDSLISEDLKNLQNVTVIIKNDLDTVKYGLSRFAHKECSDLNITESGIYTVYNCECKGFDVYCLVENRTKWTVFQRRFDGNIDFNKNWNGYKHGFGNLSGEFWLGNDLLHLISSNGKHRLRVDLTKGDGRKYHAFYSNFSVANEADKYRLTVKGYSGNAGGDSLNRINDTIGEANGMYFTTKDMDNDKYDDNCATHSVGIPVGWWYNRCFYGNLNKHPGSWMYGIGSGSYGNIDTSMMMVTKS